MAIVQIPASLRPVVGEVESVRATGATLRAVIDDLERQHPGARERILDGDAIRGDVALAVGGSEVSDLNAPIDDDDELHILPAIAGGC